MMELFISFLPESFTFLFSFYTHSIQNGSCLASKKTEIEFKLKKCLLENSSIKIQENRVQKEKNVRDHYYALAR